MQGKRRSKTGRVVSDKMDKTVVVSVERLRRHPIYKRVVRLSSKFKAHDQENNARVGDTVRGRIVSIGRSARGCEIPPLRDGRLQDLPPVQRSRCACDHASRSGRPST